MGAEPTSTIAAWRHKESREGFEVMSMSVGPDGVRLHGHTAAVADGEPWSVRYVVTVDERWHTRRAEVWGVSPVGERSLTIEVDDAGRWSIDGETRLDLDGLLDVDLESSACTNTIPVHRIGLAVGESAEAPAVWVRARDLSVERLDQTYTRVPSDDDAAAEQYDYLAPAFDFTSRLRYDAAGLILDYPGIATRAY